MKKKVYFMKKYGSIFTGLMLVSIAAFGMIGTVAADDWPMLGHDPGHTGLSLSDHVNGKHLLWFYEQSFGAHPPIIADNILYFINGSDGGNVQALHADTGELIWTYPKANINSKTPAYYEDKIYVGDKEGSMYQLLCLDAIGDPETGTTTELWSFETPNTVKPPIVADGCVFISSGSFVYCLDADPSDGTDEGFDDPDDAAYDVIWQQSLGSTVTQPAYAYNALYISTNGILYCLDADGNPDGSTDILWSYSDFSGYVQTPMLSDDKLLLSIDSLLVCLDATPLEDGVDEGFDDPDGAAYDLIWTFTAANDDINTPAVAYDRVFITSYTFFGSDPKPEHVYCVDLAGNDDGTTTVLWEKDRGGLLPATVADDKVFTGGLDDKLYCYDAATGDRKWTYSNQSSLEVGYAPVIADVYDIGQIYICYDNGLHCLGQVPPAMPVITEGVSTGEVKVGYTFTASSTDADEQGIQYKFDWGDGNISQWSTVYDSGDDISVKNSWAEPGDYEIRVKAMDTDGFESQWSDPYAIHIRNFTLSIRGGFGVNVDITNEGDLAKRVNWSIEIIGGSFPGFHLKRYFNDSNILIRPDETVTVSTGVFFCLGSADFILTVEYAGEPTLTKTVEGFVFFVYVFFD